MTSAGLEVRPVTDEDRPQLSDLLRREGGRSRGDYGIAIRDELEFELALYN